MRIASQFPNPFRRPGAATLACGFLWLAPGTAEAQLLRGTLDTVGAVVGATTQVVTNTASSLANGGITVGGSSLVSAGGTLGGGAIACGGVTVGGGSLLSGGGTLLGGRDGCTGPTSAGPANGTATGEGATLDPGAPTDLKPLKDFAHLPLRANNTSNLPLPTADGADSLAVGHAAASGGTGSLAVGTNASAGGTAATAIGTNASAAQTGAVAIGFNARTTRAGQVAIGTDQNTYTLGGVATDASRAAQAGPTQFVTTDAAGNLATSGYGPANIAALDGRVGSVENRVGAVESQLGALGRYATESRREMRQGVATALAMPTASMPSAPGRTSWVANSATYKGAWAGGMALAHRLDTAVPLALSVGYAYGGDNSHGVRAGLGGEF
ncbi:hypothetical protein [Methylobacterium sp. A54F]